jgi:hypothetical protein
MAKPRLRIPIALPIIIIVLLVLGILAGPFIQARATPEQLANNVLLSALPFLLIFIAIILAFITLISIVAQLLSHNVSRRVHRVIESILIAGIVLGILGMFQPWFFPAYTYGFLLLLFSTLAFIVWSHVVPKGEFKQEEFGTVAVGAMVSAIGSVTQPAPHSAPQSAPQPATETGSAGSVREEQPDGSVSTS